MTTWLTKEEEGSSSNVAIKEGTTGWGYRRQMVEDSDTKAVRKGGDRPWPGLCRGNRMWPGSYRLRAVAPTAREVARGQDGRQQRTTPSLRRGDDNDSQ
ncbi:hypothetical protein B296_00021688, partial [Ensete ventricosum]